MTKFGGRQVCDGRVTSHRTRWTSSVMPDVQIQSDFEAKGRVSPGTEKSKACLQPGAFESPKLQLGSQRRPVAPIALTLLVFFLPKKVGCGGPHSLDDGP